MISINSHLKDQFELLDLSQATNATRWIIEHAFIDNHKVDFESLIILKDTERDILFHFSPRNDYSTSRRLEREYHEVDASPEISNKLIDYFKLPNKTKHAYLKRFRTYLF